jgi:hypothetical protein
MQDNISYRFPFSRSLRDQIKVPSFSTHCWSLRLFTDQVLWQNNVHILTWGTWQYVTLDNKRNFATVIKGLEVEPLSWIIWESQETQRRKCCHRVELRMIQSWVKQWGWPLQEGKGRQGADFPLKSREGIYLCQHHDLNPVRFISDFLSPEL